MRSLAIVTLLLAAIGVAGCGRSIEPTQEELKERWLTGNVPPTHVRDDLIAFFKTYLNDPANVRGAQLSQPALKKVIGDPDVRFIVCVRFNARDSSGKYAGLKTGAAVFYNGKLDRFLDQPRDTRALCGAEVAYEPFPELERLRR